MREGPAVAVEVFIGLVVVVLLDPHDDAVPDKGPDAAAVRVVRRTTPCKRRIVPILVMVHALPRPVRVIPQGIPDFDHRLQRGQGEGLIG
jgi:hypothetical protein